jgi:hypothetical protein
LVANYYKKFGESGGRPLGRFRASRGAPAGC